MKGSTTGFSEACSSWFSSLSLCCAPLVSCFDEEPRRRKSLSASAISWPLGRSSDQELLIDEDNEKHAFPVVYDPPALQPRPVASPETVSQRTGWRHGTQKMGKGSGWTVFSVRSRLRSDTSRRPQISAPSDFRHVSSASFQFPSEDIHPHDFRQPRRARPSSFRPLELSIHMPDSNVSPLLSHFEHRAVATPPPAYLPPHLDEDQRLGHQRSQSSGLSFHIPRKQLSDSSLSSVQETPPRIPPKSPGRARAHTSPEMDRIKERVASAMIEMERLQKQIDEVMERQSLYSASRPSSPLSLARTMPELEPMPSIPALPPAAPSFAERLNSDAERPQTEPVWSPFQPHNRSEPSVLLDRPSPARRGDRPPPPPLPLVLRPPLRKKKSFSRVSTWLFPGEEHNRELSLDSVTNVPRPVKGGEGFYQCVSPDDRPARSSFESLNTVSTWDSDDNIPTAPSAGSPASSPMTKQEEIGLERTATFGSRDGRSTVGVAF